MTISDALSRAAARITRSWNGRWPWLRLRLLATLYAIPDMELGSIAPGRTPVQTPIQDDICLPPYHGPKDHDDYTPLMRIVQDRQPVIILELGTAYGNTVANICRHAPHAIVYTVNAPAEEQTGTVVTYQLSREEIGRVYRRHGFGGRVHQILANTLNLELDEHLDRGRVDMAIIDACHDMDFVLNDFRKVVDFVRPGGIVLFHDTAAERHSNLIGSYTACMVLRRRGYDIRHIRNTWWGVWIKPLDGERVMP